MFWVFIVLRIIRISFYYLDLIVILEWIIFEFNAINFKFIILIDWISILFIILISSIIILYILIYMNMEKYINRLNYLLLLFILSIVLIVISPNVIRILVGWDGLGIVSYCLVIYYHNYIFYNFGIITVIQLNWRRNFNSN